MEVQDRAPTFSIVAAIKNIGAREAMFRRSVESVLRQTYDDLEFVIQDGGSVDETARIVEEFGDPRIRFVSMPDSSAEEGMFRALKRCRGKYIGTCLSDEELMLDALEKALRAFQENPDASAIYGNYWTVDESGNKNGPFVAKHPFSIAAYVCQIIVPPFCASFFSRKHLERAGLHGHPWRSYVGEFELWIRVANVGRIAYIPADLSHFGRHSNSNTSTAALYDRLTAERARAMPNLFQENRVLRESGVSVEQAIAGNYAWAASSVLGIEGASDRFRRFVEAAYAHDPQDPRLLYLVQQLAEHRSPVETVAAGEEPGGVATAPEQPRPDSTTASDGASDTPYLSLVVTTRNDDHGGNMLPRAGVSRDREAVIGPGAGSAGPFAQWIAALGAMDNRLYYRDQSARSLASLAAMARQHDPTVIVELGTLAGLSLRTWLAASQRAKIVAVDLSFATLTETCRILPADLSRVTLVERDILQTDLASMWTDRDRVILFVDAHDLPGVPIMEHVLTRALPSLPDGSLVVVDDLWFSEERLTPENARHFFENRVLGEIDELQCFTGHFAPYHEGGSFMGFAEVLPLLEFVNRHGITLIRDRGGKHVVFLWKREYLSRQRGPADAGPVETEGLCGSVVYNPLASVPTAPALSEAMRGIAGVYRQRGAREAVEGLSEILTRHPDDEGVLYGLAVCLARAGRLSQARDVLACRLNDSSHPRYRRLHDDLVHHLGSARRRHPQGSDGISGAPLQGETVYTFALTPEQRTYERLPRLVDPSHHALFAQGKAGAPGYLSQSTVSNVREIHLVRHRNCVLRVKDHQSSGGSRSIEPSDYSELLPDGPHEIDFTQPLMPWFCAWGYSWQHFVQDTLPVLIGCRDYLQAHPEVEILLHEPTHDCLETLLQLVGINNRVRTIPVGLAVRIRCRELLMPRVLPRPTMWGWPPELYRRISAGLPESLPQDRLVYVSRSGCATRRIKNENQVIAFLRAAAKQQGLEMLVFDAHEMSPVERLAAFRQARIVVGPHGGANYHVLFCRPGASFIELCFYRDMHTLYNIASAAGLDYWMLPVDGGRHTAEAEVDIGLLDNALRSIFGNDERSVKGGKMPDSIDHMELSTVLDSFPSFSVIERLRASQEKYNVYSSGAAYQKERIASVAACCVREHPGDLIEIGCYVGATTRYLCQVARRYGRRVVAVDPWEVGTQNCTGGEYEAFLKSVEQFRDIVDIIRSSSLAPDAIRQIQGRELAFAFVDGLHNYEACLSDIRAVSHCHGVIAVDDTSWCPGVKQAFLEAGKELNRSAVFVPALRESYLLAGPTRTSESDAGKRTIAGAPIGCAGRSDAQAGFTLFAMPKPFAGHAGLIQRNAIRSWARLSPAPEIILFGNEPGIREMADEVGARHVPDISRNEFGTPLVDRLFQAAQDQASHEVLAYVNADMILMQDFASGVQKVHAGLPSFLLIGQRWDLSVLDEIDFNDPHWGKSLQRQLQERAMLHAECGLDYFVFRRGLWPRIPPFAIGRTAWDNWLVMDPHKRGIPVVDGTEFITAVHQDHDYGHVGGGRQEAWNGTEATKNRELAGPADLSGLTTGATWILLKDGTLAESCQRTPKYITGPYRDQRSAWLLEDARRLIAAGATDLAACRCEEALTCLDVWCDLQRMGHAPSESVEAPTIAERYGTSYVLLAQCQMQMGAYDQVLATYARLLENQRVRMPSAQRDDIRWVRDRLARHLERHRRSVCASVAR